MLQDWAFAQKGRAMSVARAIATTSLPLGLLHVGMVLTGLLGLLGFSLLCSQRPGTPDLHPAHPVHFRPVTHPEHPPWLPR